MAERKLNIMVIDTIKPGKEATIERIMQTKLIPAMRKQQPDFKWKIYRPVVGGKLGLMILIAPIFKGVVRVLGCLRVHGSSGGAWVVESVGSPAA